LGNEFYFLQEYVLHLLDMIFSLKLGLKLLIPERAAILNQIKSWNKLTPISKNTPIPREMGYF
jgi:hypothetical protein